jgi:hypothetical protein
MANCLYRVLYGWVVTHWNHDENFKNNRNLRRTFCGDCISDNRYRRPRQLPCAVTAIRWYYLPRAGANRWRGTPVRRCRLWRLLARAALSSQIRQASGVSTPRASNSSSYAAIRGIAQLGAATFEAAAGFAHLRGGDGFTR